MVRLQAVCDYLREKAHNESLLALWNSTSEPTTINDYDREYEDYDNIQYTENPLDTPTTNNYTGLNATEIPQWYDVLLDITSHITHTKFRELTEWYAIPAACVFGIIGNIWSIAIVYHHHAMRRNSSKLHYLLLSVNSIYLVLCLAFTQLRHHGIPGTHKNEAMQYLAMFLNLFQFLGIWLLYVAATDAYRFFNSFRKATSLIKLMRTPRNLGLVFLTAILLHIPLIPSLRILIWEANIHPHDPCTSPIENHWNFTIDDVPRSDIFFILYFMLLIYLACYAVPFFMLGCRDKDIIDCLQNMQERQGLPLVALQGGHTAFIVAALCNTTLFCYVLKVALMTFKLFEFAVHYMHWSHERFLYINELANLLLVIQAGVYFPILMRYSPYSRHILAKICCKHCKICWKEEQTEVPIIKVDEV